MADLNLKMLIEAADKGAAKLLGTLAGGVSKLDKATGGATKSAKAQTQAQKVLTDMMASGDKLTAALAKQLLELAVTQERAASTANDEAAALRKAGDAAERAGRQHERARHRMGGHGGGHGGGGGHNLFHRAHHHLMQFLVGYPIFMGALRLAERAVALPFEAPVEVFKWTVEQSKQISQLRASATAAGLSTDAYQALQYAYRQNNIDASKLSSTMATLNKNEMAAARRKGEQRLAFKILGVSPVDGKRTKDTEVLLNQLADAFARIHNEQKRSQLGLMLFGESEKDIVPILALGSKGLRDNAAAAQAAGRIINGETITAAEKLTTNLNDLTETVDGLANTALQDLIPIVGDLVGGWNQWLTVNRELVRSDIKGFLKGIKDAAPQLGKASITFLDFIKNTDWERTGQGIATVARAITNIADGVEAIGRAWNALPAPLRNLLGGGAHAVQQMIVPTDNLGKAIQMLGATPAQRDFMARHDAVPLADIMGIGHHKEADPVTGKIMLVIDDQRTTVKGSSFSTPGWNFLQGRGPLDGLAF